MGSGGDILLADFLEGLGVLAGSDEATAAFLAEAFLGALEVEEAGSGFALDLDEILAMTNNSKVWDVGERI